MEERRKDTADSTPPYIDLDMKQKMIFRSNLWTSPFVAQIS